MVQYISQGKLGTHTKTIWMQPMHLWKHIMMDIELIHFHGGVQMEVTVLLELLGSERCVMIPTTQTLMRCKQTLSDLLTLVFRNISMKLHLSLNIHILNCLLELNEYLANEQF